MAKFYLSKEDLRSVVSELMAGLFALNFNDNFQGFEWTGTIDPSAEVRILNKMARHIPKGFVVTDIQGSPTLVRGELEWTKEAVYLKNTSGATPLTATVFFFR